MAESMRHKPTTVEMERTDRGIVSGVAQPCSELIYNDFGEVSACQGRQWAKSRPVLLLGFEPLVFSLLTSHVVDASERAIFVHQVQSDLWAYRVEPFSFQKCRQSGLILSLCPKRLSQGQLRAYGFGA